MAVKLRLQRMGKKKQPIYKIVAADSRVKRDGRFLEAVGLYNPLTNPMTIDLKEDRVMHWLSKGAHPTDTVKNLFSRRGVMLRWTLTKKKVDPAVIATEMEKWHMAQELKLQKEAERKQRRKKAARKKAEAKETSPAAEPAPEAAPAQA